MTRLYLAPAFARADIDAQASSLRLVKGELAPIEAEVSLLTDTLLRRRPINKTDERSAKSLVTEIAQSESAESAEDQALAIAQTYLDANSIRDTKERVAAKDRAANEIAQLVLRNRITKDWLVEQAPQQALNRRQDGLISGLAIAITISPDEQDFQRLLGVASFSQTANAQHKVCVALGKLFSAGFAGPGEVPEAGRLLNEFLGRGADEPLRLRILETASVITRSTGLPVSGITLGPV